MAKLRFRQEDGHDTKIALHMSSKDGEEVKLSKPCDCDGQVGRLSFIDLLHCRHIVRSSFSLLHF